MNMNMIAKYLQFLRKSNNYTQDDLAKELGISRQAVSKWETGTTIPDLEVLLKISKLYGMTAFFTHDILLLTKCVYRRRLRMQRKSTSVNKGD